MEDSKRVAARALLRRQRRMHSRKMEIEKLKAEYERIKELNEQIIETKMRQVRLNRLFREIEEIKDMAAMRAKQRPNSPKRPKTEEEIRIENIKRARELGQEFSRLNALVKYNDYYDNFEAQQMIDKSSQKLYFLEKRLAYGNEVSRSNTEKVVKKTPKKQWNVRKPESSRLQNRLSYGNTHSYINVLLSLKQKNRNVLAELLREKLSSSDVSSGGSKDSKSAEKKQSKAPKSLKDVSRHQAILDEIRQIQVHKEKRKKNAQMAALGLPLQDEEPTCSSKRDLALKHKEESQDERENELSPGNRGPGTESAGEVEPAPTILKKKKKTKRKPLQIYGSSSEDELIATPRFIQESLLTKKQELAASHGLPPLKTTASFGEFDTTSKKSGIFEPLKVMLQRKSLKTTRNFNLASDLPIEMEQIRNLFCSEVNDEKLQQVAEEFVPEIRNAVDKEVSLYQNLQNVMASVSKEPTPNIEKQYIF